MAKQYSFGAGILWGTRTDSSVPTPIQFGTVQEVSIDVDSSVKELFGSYQYPVAVGRGTSKITGKAKMGQIQGRLLGDLYFNNLPVTGQTVPVANEAGTVPSVSAYTITVAHITGWVDLGVVYSATGLPLVKGATATAAGTYAAAAGVYTFHSGDASTAMLISYTYTTTGGETITITNQLLGTSPTFGISLYTTYNSNNFLLQLNQCVSTKLSFPTKLEDFTIQEFDFSAFADSSGNIGVISTNVAY